jgi:hypothetical protein
MEERMRSLAVVELITETNTLLPLLETMGTTSGQILFRLKEETSYCMN